MASRELLAAVLGIGGRARERRVDIVPLASLPTGTLGPALQQAHLVIGALGYQPNTIAFRQANGEPLSLASGATFHTPRVDGACRLLDSQGAFIAHAYGIGLASGFVPRGPQLGGEPSFRGQTNGLWMYQHDVGRLLLSALEADTISNRPVEAPLQQVG